MTALLEYLVIKPIMTPSIDCNYSLPLISKLLFANEHNFNYHIQCPVVRSAINCDWLIVT